MALTESARAVAAQFNPFEGNPLLDCTPPGMPALMGNPYPMEFVEVGDVIELRHEEFDVVRRIHMRPALSPAAVAASPLGYSVGRWDGDALIVTINRINWPHFGRVGVPQSEAVEVVERFSLSNGGERMDYELAISDPVTLLEPFSWQGVWILTSSVINGTPFQPRHRRSRSCRFPIGGSSVWARFPSVSSTVVFDRTWRKAARIALSSGGLDLKRTDAR
jgi:hypothetical protein